MSSEKIFVVLAIVIILPAVSLATDYVVGGERGWDFDVDYQAWAQSKEFYMGDRLVFKYQTGDHNVFKVDEAGFQACTPSPGNMPLTTGNDVVDLTTPGNKWYICGISSHCSVGGQKLSIKVMKSLQSAVPPSMSQVTGSANCMKISKYQVTIVAAMAIAMITMV